MTPEWQDASHLDLLCGKAEDIAERRIRRLLINIPPGYAKSWIFSRCFPSWYLMRYPSREFMLLSYGDDLATEHSSAARQMFGEYAPLIVGSGMAKDSKSVSRWMVETASGRGGGMMACGINSSVTGRRADVIVVDDPYKNWDDASSEAMRDRVDNAFKSVIRSRLRPGGCIILIHTRWHKDDQTGRFLSRMEHGGMPWETCILPARAVENDLLGRKPGEPLWPGMYDDQELKEVEGDIGSFFWACQFQQAPTDAVGKLFKRAWFRYFEETETQFILKSASGDKAVYKSECVTVQTVDPAATEDEKNDYFCSAVWAICPGGELLLRHVYRDHIDTTEHVDEVASLFGAWNVDFLCVSKKSHGMNLFQELESLGYPLEEVIEDTSKVSRAITMLRKYRRGQVYHLQDAEWLVPVEKELCDFPGGSNDDFVDNASAIGIQSLQFGCYGESVGVSVGGEQRVGNQFGLNESELR